MKNALVNTSIGFILLLSSLLVIFILSPSAADALSGNDFQAGRIIDDSVFNNTQTMSVQQIQEFLDSKVPNCDTNGEVMYTSTQTRAQWAAANSRPLPPYTCLKEYTQSIPGVTNGGSDLCTNSISAGTKSAAQIILDVSNACEINPQVLIVMLQKEQSLITDDWPWPTQYDKAMGYACPDSGPNNSANCDSTYFGFFNQVYNAAKAFRRYEANPNSYNYQAERNNTILYHPNTSCGTSNIYIENQATANLYIYTPYRPNQAALDNLYGTGDGCSAYGNRNFWRMFNDWFGSTFAPNYAAQPIAQSFNPAIIQGQSASVYMRFKNTGSGPWYDAISASSNYEYPVRLGTDVDMNRQSDFSKSWPHSSRASITFGKVIDSNGAITAEQHITYPGETAEFWFSFTAPINISPGNYIEAFRPIVEGYGAMEMNNNAYFKVKVQPVNYTAQYAGQSAFPTITQGQTSSAFLKYKNTGNIAWYDSTVASANAQLPVRLGTGGPLNRSSVFGSNWGLGPTRAAHVFGAVYESDGVTLAANQHIVEPGQIARFDFDFSVSVTQNPGFYPEVFRPIVEGYGAMNNTGTWLGVTVHQQP